MPSTSALSAHQPSSCQLQPPPLHPPLPFRMAEDDDRALDGNRKEAFSVLAQIGRKLEGLPARPLIGPHHTDPYPSPSEIHSRTPPPAGVFSDRLICEYATNLAPNPRSCQSPPSSLRWPAPTDSPASTPVLDPHPRSASSFSRSMLRLRVVGPASPPFSISPNGAFRPDGTPMRPWYRSPEHGVLANRDQKKARGACSLARGLPAPLRVRPRRLRAADMRLLQRRHHGGAPPAAAKTGFSVRLQLRPRRHLAQPAPAERLLRRSAPAHARGTIPGVNASRSQPVGVHTLRLLASFGHNRHINHTAAARSLHPLR
jgi:hypothetical protein